MHREPHPRVRDRCRGDPLGAAVLGHHSARTRCREGARRRAAGLRDHSRRTALHDDSRSSSTRLAERQEDRNIRARGPAVKAAFDETGSPTKAAEGFARGKGVDVDALERVEDESGAYVYAVIDEKGERRSGRSPDDASRSRQRHRLAQVHALGDGRHPIHASGALAAGSLRR